MARVHLIAVISDNLKDVTTLLMNIVDSLCGQVTLSFRQLFRILRVHSHDSWSRLLAIR
jgi:hypothetical protein